MHERDRNDSAWRAAFRLTEATAVFLHPDEQTAFFHRAYRIVKDLIEGEVTGPATVRVPEPSEN